MSAQQKGPTRPTKEDHAANALDVDQLVVGAFMEGGLKLAEPLVTMQRPRCQKCDTPLIASILTTAKASYPYNGFHVGWYCMGCVAYMRHENENLLGWVILALADGGRPFVAVDYTTVNTQSEDEGST